MSDVGDRAMAELRRRLARGGKPSDGIVVRRDLLAALVSVPWACPECTPYIVVNQGRVACARCGIDAPDYLADDSELS